MNQHIGQQCQNKNMDVAYQRTIHILFHFALHGATYDVVKIFTLYDVQCYVTNAASVFSAIYQQNFDLEEL